jgi:cell division transport system permease protein
MRALDYAIRRGWAGLWRQRGSSAFAVLAIALAIIVLGSLLLVTWNVERLLARWTAGAEFSVFLRDDATSEQRGVVEALLDQSGVTSNREYVSKEQALVRFRTEFSDLATLATGLDGNPFPASLEVRLARAADRDGRADALLRRVVTLPGVSDVRYDREWLTRVGEGLEAVRTGAFGLALLMALAAAVTVASVVRLSLDSRREEIEIMQLVGASLTFIRGPFVAEGLLQGGLGALLAIVLLGIGFTTVEAAWGAQLTAALEGMAPVFLPARTCGLLLAGGMALGGIGGLVASRHAA